MSLKLIGLQVKDFQKIHLIDLTFDPDSSSLSIGGDNEQGKSAILNAIYAALVKTPNSVQTPIRDGCENAFVRLTLGDCSEGMTPAYKIERMYETGESGKVLSQIKVTDLRSLEKVSNPSAFVARLLGDTIIDVTQFIDGLTPAQQRSLVSKIVNIDTDDVDARIKELQDNDTGLRKVQTSAEEQVGRVPYHPDVKQTAEVQASEILDELRAAVERNQSVVSLKAHGEALRQEAIRARSDVEAAEARLASLKEVLQEVESKSAKVDAEIAAASMVDEQPIRDRLGEVEALNAKIRDNLARAVARERWLAAEDATRQNLEALAQAKEERRKLLASAKMPIEGLSIGHTYLEYDGHPLSDESRARQILVAVSIALAANSDLKLILIPDAAVIKSRVMQDIITMCAEKGAQVVVEMASEKLDGTWLPRTDIIVSDGSVIAQVTGVPDGEAKVE